MNAPRLTAPSALRRPAPLHRVVGLLALAIAARTAEHPAPTESATAAAAHPGANVTVTDHHDGTVTMANGIASIVIVTKTGRLDSLTYTYDDGGTMRTAETLAGKGQYYYGGFMLGDGTYAYTLAADPAASGGGYADVKLVSDTATHGLMEIHFSMLRGSPGFYSTGRLLHRAQDEAFSVTAWGVVTRVPPAFNWLSADAVRDRMIGVPSKKGTGVPNSPHEISVNHDGDQAGAYADKFIYGQDHADLRAWGWSSVGKGGLNVGRWMMTTMEFSNGGPMKRDVSVYPYSELNNSILTGELGMGSDGDLAKGEVWEKTCGPWFIYLNSVPTRIDDPAKAAHLLHADALDRAAAEEKEWPYAWFKDPSFVPESGRGTVRGRLVIADRGDPQASAAGLWVGLQQQPLTSRGIYDFQKWLKPYQFWVQTAADGSFSIPHVLAGANYTLWAYGTGAAGTFISQHQVGGDPPLLLDLPAKPFAVTVSAGGTTELGTVNWTPQRVGATVFALGTPDRKASEFRHSEDYWAPANPPKLGFPTPVWGGQVEFGVDFPAGMTYTVGSSRWATDWNYVLPSLPDAGGAFQPCTGTIAFELERAPAAEALASLYLGCAGDDGGKVHVLINGTEAGAGVTATPNALGPDGFDPPYSDDSSIHFGNHGPFSDERLSFPGRMLRAGRNTIAITMDARRMTSYLMVDYLRLELAGYVPPAPTGVTADAGNQRALVTWRLVPGATTYTVWRSTAADGGFTALASHLVGPVCGDALTMSYSDTTAANGTRYAYAVQAGNPEGESARSAPSRGVEPSAQLTTSAPAPPTGLRVADTGHHQVALEWQATPGADHYAVWRTTLQPDGVGGSYGLRTILLDTTDAVRFTDGTPTDGRTYRYHVTALAAAGASGPSAAVTAVPLPPPPTSAPQGLA
ncbi:MAG: hypothetical protein H0X38_11050, partial [Planctomycetes bacterium]|nr:hypothetical protein [Planctomycetota bacterium]